MSQFPAPMAIEHLPPLSLYIHIPWCVSKCPYCDFNSHAANGSLPVDAYVRALYDDLQHDAHLAQGRKLTSIFFGGGTPSLMPSDAIQTILQFVENLVGLRDDCEITMEANPGSAEYHSLSGYRSAGVNRLSFGVQSFSNVQLQQLGRIHSAQEATLAIELAREAGFSNINLDLMFGLPHQSPIQALNDLETAVALHPQHISWYQLTIEANTAFYSHPPTLPDEDALWETQTSGQAFLAASGFHQYEISAYAKPEREAQHNLNYWQFGDYLAVGAGAHGKITLLDQILRYQKTRLPAHYLDAVNKHTVTNPYTCKAEPVEPTALPFEFMMNALRLTDGVKRDLYTQRTGLDLSALSPLLKRLQRQGLLITDSERLCTSSLGQQYLNSLLEQFL